MRAFCCDEFVLPLPQGHRFPMDRFPMEKYRLPGERVTEYAEVGLEVPAAASAESLRRAQGRDLLGRPAQEIR